MSNSVKAASDWYLDTQFVFGVLWTHRFLPSVGAVMSSAGIFEVVSSVLGHVITNPLYSVTELAGYPSAVYLYMAGCVFICTVIMR